MNRKIGVYGGSFDPPHRGHMAIARGVTEQFGLDEFMFVPAFHAPHKSDLKPTSAFHRYAMLALATQENPKLIVSRIELEQPDRPYSVETLGRLTAEMPEASIFFVIGADSWEDIRTWREWETVLTLTNIIVVTRPGFEIGTDHVNDQVSERIVDLRRAERSGHDAATGPRIFFTDVVQMQISATSIRNAVRSGSGEWRNDVPQEVAKYVEKYQIYR